MVSFRLHLCWINWSLSEGLSSYVLKPFIALLTEIQHFCSIFVKCVLETPDLKCYPWNTDISFFLYMYLSKRDNYKETQLLQLKKHIEVKTSQRDFKRLLAHWDLGFSVWRYKLSRENHHLLLKNKTILFENTQFMNWTNDLKHGLRFAFNFRQLQTKSPSTQVFHIAYFGFASTTVGRTSIQCVSKGIRSRITLPWKQQFVYQ